MRDREDDFKEGVLRRQTRATGLSKSAQKDRNVIEIKFQTRELYTTGLCIGVISRLVCLLSSLHCNGVAILFGHVNSRQRSHLL